MIQSVEIGKIADLVIWKPSMFGVKPEMILKNGMIVAAKIGDSNASIPTPQPIVYADMFGSVGSARYDCGFTFVSKVAFDSNIKEKYGIERNILPVKNCRNITKKDMKYNDVVEKIEVDSETYEVKVNGVKITSKPVSKVSLGQLYTLF